MRPPPLCTRGWLAPSSSRAPLRYLRGQADVAVKHEEEWCVFGDGADGRAETKHHRVQMLIPVRLLLLHHTLEGSLQQLGSCLVRPPGIRGSRRCQVLGDAPVLGQVPAHLYRPMREGEVPWARPHSPKPVSGTAASLPPLGLALKERDMSGRVNFPEVASHLVHPPDTTRPFKVAS